VSVDIRKDETVSWHRGLAAEWRCSKCQSTLTRDYRRLSVFRILDITVVFGCSAILVLIEPSSANLMLVEAFTLVAVLAFALWWLVSCRVKGTTEQA
jgi:hypothetical protein